MRVGCALLCWSLWSELLAATLLGVQERLGGPSCWQPRPGPVREGRPSGHELLAAARWFWRMSRVC